MKEKQQEIEILRKERDLERERITKAANQADQAEQSLISLTKEYEQVVILSCIIYIVVSFYDDIQRVILILVSRKNAKNCY